jgi:hypothetical protein
MGVEKELCLPGNKQPYQGGTLGTTCQGGFRVAPRRNT